MEKPIIGVTPLWDEEKKSYWMLPGYLEGVKEAGAIPVILPLTTNGADIAQLVDLCDGFLFTGGQDVDPQLYGEAMEPFCGELCPARDALEQELLRQALERDKPILGICRGIQFLNAALGGTLYGKDLYRGGGTMQCEWNRTPAVRSWAQCGSGFCGRAKSSGTPKDQECAAEHRLFSFLNNSKEKETNCS